jgi:hypothetical protein
MTQTKQARHTPLPWIAIPNGNDITTIRHINQTSGQRKELWVADCLTPNAAFIVKAVNSHEELLGALDVEMLLTIANELDSFKDSARAHSLRVLAARQQKAITRAVGE